MTTKKVARISGKNRKEKWRRFFFPTLKLDYSSKCTYARKSWLCLSIRSINPLIISISTT